MGPTEMSEIADCIADLIEGIDDAATLDSVRERTLHLCSRFPLPYAFD
jgi:glycine/serine hydroxymethyltransferase